MARPGVSRTFLHSLVGTGVALIVVFALASLHAVPVNHSAQNESPAVTTTSSDLTGLAESHDNDAGHSRKIDTTPDADLDWYQIHPAH